MLAPDTIPIAVAIPLTIVLTILAVWPVLRERDDD